MFDGLKSRLGFQTEDDYDDEFYDDYDAYSDNYDDFSTYDDGAEEEDTRYSRYHPVTTRAAGTHRQRNNSYAERTAAYESRRVSSNPPLLNMQEVRASTPQVGYSSSEEPLRRSSVTGRATAIRASDFALSGSEIDSTPLSETRATTFEQSSPIRRSGYNSLFESSPTESASSVPSVKQTPIPPSRSAGAEGGYDPYKAYEGAGSASHQPTRKVSVIAPEDYADVESIARTLKAGDAVVLDLRGTPAELTKRVLDFSFGVASALDASVNVAADKVFAITRLAALTETEITRLKAQGVL